MRLINTGLRPIYYCSGQKVTVTEQVLGLQLDRPAISKIETGYREVTDVEIVALAKALDVSVAWLFEESDKTTP